ncbi:MAG: hypothetical protein OHK0021_17970 [Bryobacter sp.]
MMRQEFSFGALLVLAATAGLAQTQFASYRTGFVYDVRHQILRPIEGFPGSAVVGPALVSGISAALPAPAGKWHLLEKADGWHLVQAGAWTESVASWTEVKQAIWAEDTEAFLLVRQSGEDAPRFELYRLAGQSWELAHTSAWPVGLSFEGTRLCGLEGRQSGEARIWLKSSAREDDPAAAALWLLRESTGEAQSVHDGPVQAFSLPAKGKGTYAFSTADNAVFFLREVSGNFYAEASGLEVPAGLQLTALRMTEENEFLSAWWGTREAGLVESRILVRNAIGESRSFPAEARIESFSPTLERQQWLLNASLSAENPLLYLYSAALESVFFIPELPLESGTEMGKARETGKANEGEGQ